MSRKVKNINPLVKKIFKENICGSDKLMEAKERCSAKSHQNKVK